MAGACAELVRPRRDGANDLDCLWWKYSGVSLGAFFPETSIVVGKGQAVLSSLIEFLDTWTLNGRSTFRDRSGESFQNKERIELGRDITALKARPVERQVIGNQWLSSFLAPSGL